jgi:membrane-bound lytic murein transglycosylase D
MNLGQKMRTKPFDIELFKNPFVLGAVGVLLLIGLVAVAFPKKNNKTENRLDKLESRLTDIEEIRLKTGRIEEQRSNIEMLSDRIGKLETDMNMFLERLEKRSEIRKDAPKPASAKPNSASKPPEKKIEAAKPAPKKKESPKVHKAGGQKYHKVKAGETVYQIAGRYGLTVKELLRLNHLGANPRLQPEQQLIVGY